MVGKKSLCHMPLSPMFLSYFKVFNCLKMQTGIYWYILSRKILSYTFWCLKKDLALLHTYRVLYISSVTGSCFTIKEHYSIISFFPFSLQSNIKVVTMHSCYLPDKFLQSQTHFIDLQL